MLSDSKITGASQAGATQSSIFQQVSLKVAIVAALVAVAAIALVYAEVKYRFVSTIVSFVVANPLVLGVIALVVLIGYLLYRNGKQTPNDSQTRELQSDIIDHETDQALDAEVNAWITERIRVWRLNGEMVMNPDVQRMVPISEQEFLGTVRPDSFLVAMFREDFAGRGTSRATLNGARRILNLVLHMDEQLAARTQDAVLQQDYLGRHARRLSEGTVSLRWLMNPMIFNQNNINTN